MAQSLACSKQWFWPLIGLGMRSRACTSLGFFQAVPTKVSSSPDQSTLTSNHHSQALTGPRKDAPLRSLSCGSPLAVYSSFLPSGPGAPAAFRLRVVG